MPNLPISTRRISEFFANSATHSFPSGRWAPSLAFRGEFVLLFCFFLLVHCQFQLCEAAAYLPFEKCHSALHATGSVAAELQVGESSGGGVDFGIGLAFGREEQQRGQLLLFFAGEYFDASDEDAFDFCRLGSDRQRHHFVCERLRKNSQHARAGLGEPEVVPGGDHGGGFVFGQALSVEAGDHRGAQVGGNFGGGTHRSREGEGLLIHRFAINVIDFFELIQSQPGGLTVTDSQGKELGNGLSAVVGERKLIGTVSLRGTKFVKAVIAGPAVEDEVVDRFDGIVGFFFRLLPERRC